MNSLCVSAEVQDYIKYLKIIHTYLFKGGELNTKCGGGKLIREEGLRTVNRSEVRTVLALSDIQLQKRYVWTQIF